MNCHFLQKRNGKIQLKWIKLTFGAMLDQLRFIFVEWNMCHLADRMANAIINTFCAVHYYYQYLRAWACGRCIIACVYRQNVWTHKAQQTAFATTHTIPWIRNCIFNWTTICSFDFSCLILMSVHFWLVDGPAQVSPSQIQFSFGCVCDVRALGEWWVHLNVLFIELNTPGTRYTFISHFVLAFGERVRVWSDKILICIYNWVSYNLWARAWHNCHAFYYSNLIRLSAVQHRQWAGRLLPHLSEWSYHWCGHKSSPIKLCFGSSDKSELLNWRTADETWVYFVRMRHAWGARVRGYWMVTSAVSSVQTDAGSTNGNNNWELIGGRAIKKKLESIARSAHGDRSELLPYIMPNANTL